MITCCNNPDVVWIHHHAFDGEECDPGENCKAHRKCSNCDSGICEEC